MRILYIVHQYPQDKIGGAELYTQAISRALARRGHDVAVFYRRDVPSQGLQYRAEKGVGVYAVWDREAGLARRFLYTFRNLWFHRALIWALDEFHPDVVHIQYLMGLLISLVSAFRQRSFLSNRYSARLLVALSQCSVADQL